MAGRFPREEEGAGSGEKSAALFGGPAFLLLLFSRGFFTDHGEVAVVVVWFSKESSWETLFSC